MNNMKNTGSTLRNQSGVMLLEALISILIFSVGILAVVGLQAASIKNAADAKFRADASLLAAELFAQMQTSDRTQSTLQNNFNAGGAGYNTWLTDVAAKLPGVAGVTANQPTVSISANTATAASTSDVTVTIYWSSPNEGVQAHQFIAVAKVVKT